MGWDESRKRHEKMKEIGQERRNGIYFNTNKPLPLLPRRQPATVKNFVVRKSYTITATTGQQVRIARFFESFDEPPLTPDSEEMAFDPLAGHRFLAEEEAMTQFSEEAEHQRHSSQTARSPPLDSSSHLLQSTGPFQSLAK
jgi:hypothetical protein